MNAIVLNKEKKKSVTVLNNYIWYWPCNICNKNAVGSITCSTFYFAITKPSYLDENGEIKNLALCELCIEKHGIDDLLNKKILIDSNEKTYEIQGLENGQYLEQLDCI